MNKSGLWGKRVSVIAVMVMILVLSLLALSACSGKLEIEAMEVVSDSVPGVAMVGEFDITQINLNLTLADGTTQKISAENSMLTAESREALKTPGQKTVTLYYLNKTTIISILLVDSGTETVNITFLDKDGIQLAKKYAVKDGEIVAPVPPAEVGKIFSGWRIGGDGEMLNLAKVNSSAVVYATYAENLASYTVVFKDYKNNTISTSTVTHGSKVTPPNYSKPAELSSFSWGINFSTYTITENTTFYMSYEYATKVVTYFYAYSNNLSRTYPLQDENNKQFYENVKINNQIQNKEQARALLRDQSGVSLQFIEWKDAPSTIATDTMLVAIVEPRLYKISYEDGFYSPIEIEVGTTFSIPNSAKEKPGYSFNSSWVDTISGNEYTGSIIVSANMNLRPIYTKKIINTKYIVTFSGTSDSDNDIEKEVLLNSTYFGDVIDIEFINSQVLPAVKALCAPGTVDNYQIDKITFRDRDVTSEDVVLAESTGGAAQVFNIIAVDSSLPTKGLVFTMVGDAYTVSSYIGTAVNIYIPNTYKSQSDASAIAVTAIGANVFMGKTVNVQIPSSVVKIGSNAFENAILLGDVNLSSVSELGVDVFKGAKEKNNRNIKVTFGTAITAIPAYTFFDTKNITEVVIPSSVLTIGASAFEQSDITTINLSKITTIAEKAFFNSKLANITNLSSLESVGNNALAKTAIISLDMPKLSTVGTNAFADMNKLTTFSIGTDLNLEVGQEKSFDFGCILHSKNILTITIGEGFNTLVSAEINFNQTQFITETINLPASWAISEFTPSRLGFLAETLILPLQFKYLKNINVAQGNTVYASDNGVLFKLEESSAILLAYPGNKNGNYTIPDIVKEKSVTEVDINAFSTSNINNLTMGANIALDALPLFGQEISISTIVAASMLGNTAEASLLNIVTAIGTITKIYVNGTVENFETIVSDNSWENVFMLNGGTYSVYDATYDMVYTVKDNKATIVHGNKRASEIVVPVAIGNITVNAIQDGAFAGYQYLENLTINAVLKGLASNVLSGCVSLSNITIAGWESSAQVNITAFADTKYYQNTNLILLGGKLIGYNNSATTLDSEGEIIPLTTVSALSLANVVTIPDNFFSGSNLTSITLPDSVKNIGQYAFQNCGSLKQINLNKTTFIAEGAFRGSGLTSIILTNVIEMKAGVFFGCESLISVVIPNAINSGSLPYGTFEDCIALTTVEMPYIIRFSEDSSNISRAFANCISLVNISFIANLSSIPGETFSGCSAIETVDFTTSSATSIGAGAFKDCTALIYLVISATITSLGDVAFSGCDNLNTIKVVGNGGILLATTPWNGDIFPNTSNIYINLNASRASLANYNIENIKTLLPSVRFEIMPNFGVNTPLNKDTISDVAYLTNAPQTTTFNGYIFDAWYVLVTGSTYAEATFPMLVTENITLYAKYYSLTKGSLSDDDVEYSDTLGGFVVTKFANVAADRIFIPTSYTKINGTIVTNYPIVAIMAGAFSDCANLTSIIIPEGVKQLSVGGKFANGTENPIGVFNNNLTYIYLPSSLEIIIGDLFTNIANLDIEFGENCNLYRASTSAFTGTKWFIDEQAKAETGVNNRFILAGRLALRYMMPDIDVENPNVEKLSITVPNSVIKLNDNLFAGNEEIGEIRINDNLLYIGANCFANATNLKYVNYSSGSTANSKLKALDLAAFIGTEWLADQNMVIIGTILAKYYDYNGETTVEIPDYITEISANAFENVTLNTLRFGVNSKVKVIADYAFKNTGLISVNLPATVETLGKGVFQNCAKLTEANLSATQITFLSEDLFSGCVKIHTLNLNVKVKAFNKASLANCRLLNNITASGLSVTNNLNTEIAEGGAGLTDTLWYNAPVRENAQYLILGKVLVKFIPSSITSDTGIVATVPSGVETILTRAFASSAITKAIIASSVKIIEASAFINCSSLVEVEFVNGSALLTIGESAFNNCIKLAQIILPSTLEKIATTAFMGAALTELVIPDSVVHLGERSFYGNAKLTFVKMGSGITKLGKRVFYNCNNLYKVEWTATEQQLIAIAEYIEEAITIYNITDYRVYIEELFKRDTVGKAIRIYMDNSNYNFVANSNPNLPDSTELDKQINAWATRLSFSLFMAQEYPEITFEDSEGYYMQSFKAEVITTIGTPAKTGNTFMGWYLDAAKTVPLVLPYKVYSSMQLYAKWYTNDLPSIGYDANLTFVYNAINSTYTVSSVEGSESELYIPSTVVGRMVSSINVSANTHVKKLVLTNASNFNAMTTNIFRFFPNLEQLVLLNTGTIATTYKVEDGLVYSLDGTKLIAYIARYKVVNEVKVKETEFTIPLGVTEIADYAFMNSGLTSILINRNVTKIGCYAFNNSLQNITFAVGINITSADSTSFDNTAWYLSSAAFTANGGMGFFYSAGNILLEYKQIVTINNLVIPDELKGVRITTFASYLNVASRIAQNTSVMTFANLKLPEYLLRINTNAFKDIDITNNIQAGNSLVEIADNVFSETNFYISSRDAIILGKVLVKWVNMETNIVVPSGIVAISNKAFDASQVVTITLPESLKYIGDNAFYGCERLLEVTIPINVVSIGKNAFNNNKALNSVKFNTNTSKLISIGDRAFSNCSSLIAIEIPHGVESIGNEVFLNCKKLKTVTFDYIERIEDPVTSVVTSTIKALSKLKTLGSGAFYNCETLTEISIPKDIAILNQETFYNCKALLSVKFDANQSMLKTIAARAFYNCINLGSKINLAAPSLITVVLPNRLETIKENAFENCSGMYGIQLNYNVKSIETNVFYGCVRLAKISIYSATPAVLSTNAFTRATATVNPYYRLRIYVNTSENAATKRLYQRAWTAYSFQIFQRDELPSFKYYRVTTGSGGGSGETVYSGDIYNDLIVNPTYVWGATNYVTWQYTSLSTIILNSETFQPERDPTSGEIQLDVTSTDTRLNKELGSESYQKFEQNGVTYTLLILDYDYTLLKAL